MSLSIALSHVDPTTLDADVLVVWATNTDLAKQKHLAPIDELLGGALQEQALQASFKGLPDTLLELPTLGRLPARRLIVVGVGAKRGLHDAGFRRYAAQGARAAQARSARTLAVILPEKASGQSLRSVAEGVVLGAYRFTKYFTGERKPKAALEQVELVKLAGKPSVAEKRAIQVGEQVAAAVCLARDLVNEPPNVVNPEALAAAARDIARHGKLKIKVLDKAGLHKAGMGLHYAVGQGSANEPRFIHLSYTPARSKKKLVFVGKGLTFDSGGLCIKPAPGMEEMKSDMSGAAAVLGLMAAVAVVKPNVEVHGLIAAAENMPDGGAYRPGDIFTSLSGKTVEIINTDAEGRLVLADALSYAVDLKPDAIVEASTLTGACMVALGRTCSGLMCTDDRLAKQVEGAARDAGEAFWRLPLLEELKENLRSTVADLKHHGDRMGGAIIAGLFLAEFVGDVPFAHCDIAGPAFAAKPRGIYSAGGTGAPVLTLLRIVESQPGA